MSVSMFRLQLSPLNPRFGHSVRAMHARAKAKGHPEYCRFHDRAEEKADFCILGLSPYQCDRAPHDVDITVQLDP